MDTPIHRMHPLVMAIWALTFMILVAVIEDPLMQLALFAATLPFIYTARIFDRWWGFFKLSLVFSVFIIVLNVIFMHQGSTVIYSFPYEVPTMGHFDITMEAFFYSVGIALRLTTMITIFAILTYTVNPDEIFELLMKVRFLQGRRSWSRSRSAMCRRCSATWTTSGYPSGRGDTRSTILRSSKR